MAKVELYTYYCRNALITLLIFFPSQIFSQYLLHIRPVDKDEAFISNTLKLQTNFKSKTQCTDYVNKLPGLMHSKGYVSASVDSTWYDSTTTFILLYSGDAFRMAYLNTDSVDKQILAAVNWDKREFGNRPLQVDQLQALQQSILNHLENSGYPFAKITLDSIRLQNNVMQAILKVEKGPLYKIDSIRNGGPAKISSRFLQRYLNILNGSVYKKDNLLSISRKIDALPYVQEQQPWSITWLGTGSTVNLSLAPRRSSQVNVLVGLLPASSTSNNIYEEPRTKLQFTGEANINLRNSLGNGETIGLNWQQIQVKSPRLNLAYQQPYLFGSPFGASFAFDLFKKDTSFITINLFLGAQYAVSSNQSGSLFIQNLQSNLITVDTNYVIQNRQLPPEADVHSVSLGIRYDGYSTNFRYNPTKGNEWQFVISAGTKKVKENSVIIQLTDKNDPSFDFSSLYDTIQLNSFQFRINGMAAHYFPLSRVSTVRTAVTGGWFQSPDIFRNELFQIGGYKLLRGFDEESIYASQYAVTTGEYRYLIGRNSFLFAFVDFGWARNTASSGNSSHTYFGTGLGMALETKAGIFNISYAVGKRNDLNFDLRQSKIHFGYVNFF